jgi:hypothetical protein
MWDIDGRDWECWRQGRTAHECAAVYIATIQNVRKGIVLMQDGSFEDDIRSRSYTFEMAKVVVDWLQQNGYTFVPLDSIPQVCNAVGVSSVGTQ